MELTNITVKELALSIYQNEYDSVLFALKPKNNFCGKSMDVNDMPYINTRRCLSLITKGQDWQGLKELFELSFGVKDTHFWGAKVVDFYHARNFLIQEWKRIIELENRLNGQIENKDEGKWKRAGIDRLNQFSDVLPLDRLGQRYSIYPFDLGQKPYSEILYLISLATQDSQVNSNYYALK